MKFRFKLLSRFKRDKTTAYKSGGGLAKALLAADIEKRADIIQIVKYKQHGQTLLRDALKDLRRQKSDIAGTLNLLTTSYIVETLVVLYNYSPEEAKAWATTTGTKQKLADKLPALPEVTFQPGTNQRDVDTLKHTFKARVEQVDRLNTELAHIKHIIDVMISCTPGLREQNETESQANVTPH